MSSVIQTILKKKSFFLVLLLVVVGFALPVSPAQAGFDLIDIAEEALLRLLNNLLFLILSTLSTLLSAVGTLADVVMQPAPLTTYPPVILGWTITRDFANMFFILILLGVALDFILFNSFGVKQALPRLLLVALLINFSLPIAGVLIDFANAFTSFFLQRIGAGQITEAIAQSLKITEIYNTNGISGNANAIGALRSVLINQVFGIFFLIGTIYVFGALAILFIIRTGYLYALLVLLPLALVLSAFPPMRGQFGKWTNAFIKWALFAPGALFFLYLATLFFNAIIVSSTMDAIKGKDSTGIFGMLYAYVTIWIFLLGSLFAAQSVGGKAAGTALAMYSKGAKWARGKAYGAAKTTAAAAGRRVGADKSLEGLAKGLQRIPMLGGVLASGTRGIAAKTKAAMEKQEAPTTAQKAKWEGLSDAALAEEQKVYEKSVVPGSGAKVAQIAAIRARRGKLNVRKADGEIDIIETEKEVRKAYAAAKQSKNKEALDLISKSSPLVFGKIKTEEFEEDLKKGDVIASSDPLTKERVLRNRKTGEFLHEVKNKALDSMTTKDFENMKGAWSKKDIEEFINGGAISSSHIRMADNATDSIFINHIQEVIDDLDRLTSTDMNKVINKFMVLTKKNQAFVNSLKSGKLDQLGVRVSPDVVAAIDLAQERIRKGLPLI